MSNFSKDKLWNIGRRLSRRFPTWIELTNSDEWDNSVVKFNFSKEELKLIRESFEGKTQANFKEELAKDDGIMPFGAHKDKKFSEVPLAYMLWARSKPWLERWPVLANWIANNKSKLDEYENDSDEGINELRKLKQQLK